MRRKSSAVILTSTNIIRLCGSCRDYLVAGPYKDLKKYKAQDWNQIEIVVKGKAARCTCNGELLEAAFAVPETGPIGLEGDRGQMEYRRIQIKTP